MLMQDRILAVLGLCPGASGAEIRGALPDCKHVSITRALARLRDTGRIESAGWGAYRLPVSTIDSAATKKTTFSEALKARMMAGR